MELKKITVIALVGILFFNFIFLVNAQATPIIASQDVTPLQAFFNNLNHALNTGTFSVVGNSRTCGTSGGNPNKQWNNIPTNQVTSLKASDYCTGGYGLFDFFTNGWTPYVEFKDSLYVKCGTGPCNIQLYCCPKKEPDCSQADIISCGTGSTCKTVSCYPTPEGANTFYSCPNENNILYERSSYSYCTSSNTMTCYYRLGYDCPSNIYDKSLFPNSCESYEYSGGKLYSSYNTCKGELGRCQSDSECNPGQVCSSGNCVNPSGCTPDCTNKCGGVSNGCGGTCNAECDSSGNPVSSGTCSDGIRNQDETGVDCGGICNDCGTPTTDDLSQYIIVSNIKLPSYGLGSFESVGTERSFKVTLKNTDSKIQVVNVEAGFYTYYYAKNVAKLFSIYSTVAPQPIANCVGTEPFVKTVAVTLRPRESKTIEIKIAPINSYVTMPIGNYILEQTKLTSFLGVMAHAGDNACCKKLTDFEGCVGGTGGYIDSKYDPGFYIKDSSMILNEDITCGGEIYGKIDHNFGSTDKIIVNKKYQECIDYTFYTKSGTIDENATRDYLDEIGSFEKIKKFSLTKNEIKSFPTQDLIASSCLSSSECLERENYSVSCIRLNKLKEEGLIGDTEVNDMANKAKATFAGGAFGAGAFLTICAISPLVTAGASLIACGIGGALIGSTLGFGLAEIDDEDFFNKDDALTKAIKSGDSTSYGICTAEPKGLDIMGFLEKIGKALPITKNPQTDGIIIVVGAFIIIFFFVSAMGGRK